jgi:serine/threonine protein kinase
LPVDDYESAPEAVTAVIEREPTEARQRARHLVGTELLGRYVVEEEIGHGGMATVYRGRHNTIGKQVAIKVLDRALGCDAVERFLQEARVTSRVIHENVVEVNDFGVTTDGFVFSVMELLHGETLGDLVDAEGPLPPARAAAIMLQICSALQAAHELGIIHRDLKPDNCFRAPRSSNTDFIKVLDFGIARITSGASQAVRAAARARTEVGCIVGTPDYMAPEQARAEPFDHRVDVYAAGGLFFELLTGHKPYQGRCAAEQLAAHLHSPVPDPGEHTGGLCPAIREVVSTAMAKDADDRHPSMAALARAIQSALREQKRWNSPLRRTLEGTAAMAATIAALVIGSGFVDGEPSAVASVGMAELASPRLVLKMKPIVRARPVRVTPKMIDPLPLRREPAPVLAEAAPHVAKKPARPHRVMVVAPPELPAPVDRAIAIDPVPTHGELPDVDDDTGDEPLVPEFDEGIVAKPRPHATDLKDPFVDG